MKKLKKRDHSGSRNPNVSLNLIEVLTIRRLYAEGSYKQIALAATFGVSQGQISRIVSNHRWRTD